MSQHDKDGAPAVALHEALRARREQRKLSYAEVEQETSIRGTVLHSIEEARWEQLPAPYMRSFVRKYGLFLGMPADQLEALMDSTFTGLRSGPGQTATADVGGGTFQSNDLNTAFSTPANSILTKIIYATIVVALLFVAMFVLLDSDDPEDETLLTNVPPAVEPLNVGTAAVSAGDAQNLTSAVDLSDSLTLRADASAEIWISMVMDGRKSWEGILQEGESISWKAKDNFKLTLGNAGAVSFFYLGEKVPPLGSKVMRDVRVNRKGIFASNGRVFTPRHLRVQAAPDSANTAIGDSSAVNQ